MQPSAWARCPASPFWSLWRSPPSEVGTPRTTRLCPGFPCPGCSARAAAGRTNRAGQADRHRYGERTSHSIGGRIDQVSACFVWPAGHRASCGFAVKVITAVLAVPGGDLRCLGTVTLTVRQKDPFWWLIRLWESDSRASDPRSESPDMSPNVIIDGIDPFMA